jgi:hypothetical protein
MEKATFKVSASAVHVKCYDDMVDIHFEDHPGVKPPAATPIKAGRLTMCPRCHRVIHPGDVIVVTDLAEWAFQLPENREQICDMLLRLHSEKEGDAVIFGVFDFIATAAWVAMGPEARRLVDKLHPQDQLRFEGG